MPNKKSLQVLLNEARRKSPAQSLTAKEMNYLVGAQDRVNNPYWHESQKKVQSKMLEKRRKTNQEKGLVISDEDRDKIYWGQYECKTQADRASYITQLSTQTGFCRDTVRDCVTNRFNHIDTKDHDRYQREWLDRYGEEYVLYAPSYKLIDVYDEQYLRTPSQEPYRKMPSLVWRVRQGESIDQVFESQRKDLDNQTWINLKPRIRKAHQWIKNETARIYRFSSGRSALIWLNKHTHSCLDIANPQNKFSYEPRVMWKSRQGNHLGWILHRKLCSAPWLITDVEVIDMRSLNQD